MVFKFEDDQPFPNENNQIEYKEEFSEKVKREIAAFLNGNKVGYIYFGVNDISRSIVKIFSDEEKHSIEEEISHWLSSSKFYPSPIGLINIHVESKLFYIEILPGKSKPYFLDEKVYIRNNSESVKASPDLVNKMLINQNLNSFDLAESLNQELSFDRLRAIFRRQKIEFKPKSLGFYNESQKFTNTALLMSDQNLFSIKIAVFDGINVNQFKNRKEFIGPLPEQIDSALEFIDLNNRLSSKITGKPQREDTLSYPKVAIREAVVNAVVHRSYFSKSPIQIEIFDDRLTIMSPGSLPGGIQIKAVLDGQTLPRNSQVIKILHRLNYIEDYGTGIRRIIGSYSLEDKQPSFNAQEDFVKVSMPDLNYEGHLVEQEFVNVIPENEVDSEWSVKILEYLNEHSYITRPVVELLLSVKKTQASDYLKNMASDGILKKIGSGPSTRYIRI